MVRDVHTYIPHVCPLFWFHFPGHIKIGPPNNGPPLGQFYYEDSTPIPSLPNKQLSGLYNIEFVAIVAVGTFEFK